MTDTNATTTEGAAAEGGAHPVDQPTAQQDNSRAVAVIPKQRLVATSDVAIWDTAAFEHMGRVGRVMADSGLANETLFKDNDQPAPEGMVVARMVMIANLARECGANPLMFLQGCSIISRKLHLEGKVVNAVIRARTGVVLKFRFGVWDTDHIEFPPEGDDGAFFHGVGERLAVRCYDPEDPERFVDGSVGLWKTDRNGSPWAAQGNWRRQLRYRAAPEWARAYEPGAVLGFYSDADEDLDDIAPPPRGPRSKRDLTSKLTNQGHDGEHGAEGFNRDHVANLGEATAAHDPETGEVHEAEFTDKTDAHTEAEKDGTAALMARAEGLAKIAPNDETADEIAARLEAGAENGDKILDGHAEDGEQYLLAGDSLDASHRRLTYKNGERFSAVKSFGKFNCYAIHAPALEDDDAEAEGLQGVSEAQDRLDAERAGAGEGWDHFSTGIGGVGFRKVGAVEIDRSVQTHPGEGWELVYGDIDSGEMIGDGSQAAAQAEVDRRAAAGNGSTETGGVQSAASEQASPASATPASEASPPAAEASSPSASSSSQGGSQPSEDSFLGRCRAATSWSGEGGIKAEYGAMAKTTDWMGASEAEKDEVRRAIWAEVVRVKQEHRDPIDHATDPTAFGIWLATQPKTRDGADAVEGTFQVLQAQPIWAQMKPAQHKALEDRVQPFLKAARG